MLKHEHKMQTSELERAEKKLKDILNQNEKMEKMCEGYDQM